MVRNIFASLVVFLLLMAVSSPAYAQDAAKKMDKKKEMKEMGTLKEVSCDPACGFSVRSRNEKELIAMVKLHAKKIHKMDMKDEDVKAKMKEVKM